MTTTTAVPGDSPAAPRAGLQYTARSAGARAAAEAVRPLRVAVVGAGRMGALHAGKYGQLPCCELRAIVDAHGDRAAALAARHGAEAYTDHRRILDQVDAVSVATPASSHFAIARDCLEAGLDVLVEKPIATGLDEAARLVELAAAHGRVLQVGHIERFNPAARGLERLQLQPLFVDCRRESRYSRRGTDVDVVLDLMIHDIDLVLNLIGGAVVAVEARGERVRSDGIDVAEAWLRFDGGCEAHLHASRLADAGRRRLRLFESEAYADADLGRGALEAVGRRLGGACRPPAAGDALLTELTSFLRCVRRRLTPEVDGVQGLRALELALRVRSLIASRLSLHPPTGSPPHAIH